MKKISIENKPFYVTLSVAIVVIIFFISCTWAVAVIKINIENKVDANIEKINDIDKRLITVESKQSQQDLDMVEVKTDLKYIIQMQEETRNFWIKNNQGGK